MAGRRRRQGTLPDLLRTMLVFAVVIGAFLLLLPRHHHDAVRPVDPTQQLEAFRRGAGPGAPVPNGLPAGWAPTSARAGVPDVAGGTASLHVGYVTPGQRYAAVEESTSGDVLGAQTRGARPAGTVDVAGAPWARYDGRGGFHALSRVVGRTTVVVVGAAKGGATVDELRALAGALR